MAHICEPQTCTAMRVIPLISICFWLASYVASQQVSSSLESQYTKVTIQFNEPVEGRRIWPIRLTGDQPSLTGFGVEKKYTITGAFIIQGSSAVECFLVSNPPSRHSELGILPTNTNSEEYVSQLFSRHSPLRETRFYVVGIICNKRKGEGIDAATLGN